MAIVVDTREQTPYEFSLKTVRSALKAGDYSLEGYEAVMAVERKGLADLFSCLGGAKKRFKQQLARLARLRKSALVVDAEVREVLAGYQYSQLPGEEALARLISYTSEWGIPVYFAGRRGAVVAAMLLREWQKYVLKPRK